MLTEIGHVERIIRYPVKSMAGEPVEKAMLGWHGLEGDRRLALRKTDDCSGFPWLSASRLPDLLRFIPLRRDSDSQNNIPTHICTPEGKELPAFGEELAADVSNRLGARVQMMHLKHGIFDEGSISVIANDTVREIGRMAGMDLDIRRFRPNVVVRSTRSVAFEEDNWLGCVLEFGEVDEAPAISVTSRDVRCSMVNLNPDTAGSNPEIMKAIVRANQNNAGVYGTVTRVGKIVVGQKIYLHSV